MSTFNFKIVTPERVVFDSEAEKATLPTNTGEITILPNHIPLVSQVVAGEMRITDAEHREHLLAVSGGFVQVQSLSITILADTAEMAHELSEERAKEAHERARKLLEAKTGLTDRDVASLQALIDKELARVKVARKHKDPGIRSGLLK